MAYIAPDAQIASGLNNAAGLALVTSLTVGGVAFVEVNEFPQGFYSRGEPKTTTTGVVRHSGYKSRQWRSGVLYLTQWEYLRANFEGLVTIHTRVSATTYANFNAVLSIGEMGDYEVINLTRNGQALRDFVWVFTKLEAI